MRIVAHPPPFGEVHVSATETELNRLAELVATGDGSLTCESESTEPGALAAVEVVQATGPGVRIHVDTARQVLVISGHADARNILADNLRGTTQMEDGGHLHVDYFPDHPYLGSRIGTAGGRQPAWRHAPSMEIGRRLPIRSDTPLETPPLRKRTDLSRDGH